ncbi:unnamed protein product [Caenorhabditis auriculariae]|uniref:Hcy-binding domain-containing protein n=1 Tax=Caenorhabditis auriculariae TaxID=2777116 RepID=A0A8S1H5F6_9PELO|nr:unnamed protein product [Caenorhabditis auriculariae]
MSSKNIMRLDGSFSSELKSLGFIADDHKLWTFAAIHNNSKLILQAHKNFLNAGADYLTTNTYHAAIPLMKKEGIANYEELVAKTVRLAKQALKECYKGNQAELFGSIGSYSTCLRDQSEYTGSYVDNDLDIDQKMVSYYWDQIKMLHSSPNLLRNILIETVPALAEVKSLTKAIQTYLSGLPPSESVETKFFVSFTCKENGLLRHGESIKAAADHLVYGIGINCTDKKKTCRLLFVESKKQRKTLANLRIYWFTPTVVTQVFQIQKNSTITCRCSRKKMSHRGRETEPPS